MFDVDAWEALCRLKKRDSSQSPSWLVRSSFDIEKYAIVTEKAQKIIDEYLPGSLTIVLKLRAGVETPLCVDRTVGFRISSDSFAQQTIADFMKKYESPLTCTSANVHGEQTRQTVPEILEQFGEDSKLITEIVDDGMRNAEASTIIRCVGGSVEILRKGSISSSSDFINFL